MNSRLIRRAFSATALLFTVVACTSTPLEKLDVPAHAFSKQSRYAILWVKPCNVKVLGGCDRDDGRTTDAKLVIHGSVNRVNLKQEYEDGVGLSASIARVSAVDTINQQYLREFKDAMSARGMDFVAVAKPLYEGALAKQASTQVTFADQPRLSASQFPLQVKSNTYDFNPLYEQLDVDFLLVLELLNFSIDRHYGPTGKQLFNPQAVSAIRVYLHERVSGEILFNDFSYDFAVSDDEWDKPPHYQNLADLLAQTLEASIAEAKTNLMKLNF